MNSSNRRRRGGARVFLALLGALACACAGDIIPRAGVWDYNPGAVIDDMCMLGSSTFVDPYGEFTVGEVTSETFIVNTGSAEPFDCRLLGDGAFECPERLEGTYPVANVDVTLVADVRVDGTFTTETAAEGAQTVTIACEGADCENPLVLAVLASQFPDTTLPCSYRVEFTATAR